MPVQQIGSNGAVTTKTRVTAGNRKELEKFYVSHDTSDEDEEGVRRPKLGEGITGVGPSLFTFHLGRRIEFHDGAGPHLPGRAHLGPSNPAARRTARAPSIGPFGPQAILSRGGLLGCGPE